MMCPIDPQNTENADTDILLETRTTPKRPPRYCVILVNDNFTPMDFVVIVLQRFFKIDHENAVKLMLQIHEEGQAVAGIYSYEIAETKVTQVMDFARKHEHPLQCTLKAES